MPSCPESPAPQQNSRQLGRSCGGGEGRGLSSVGVDREGRGRSEVVVLLLRVVGRFFTLEVELDLCRLRRVVIRPLRVAMVSKTFDVIGAALDGCLKKSARREEEQRADSTWALGRVVAGSRPTPEFKSTRRRVTRRVKTG